MEINNSYNTINFLGRKIPRYLYHFTDKKNYTQMCKDGFIKISDKDPYLDSAGGIFTVDWTNFCKLWGCNKSWGETIHLQEYLLRNAVKWIKSTIEGANELVILKIPTDKLKPSKLAIRSQNLFFKVIENEIRPEVLPPNKKAHLLGHTLAKDAKKIKRKYAVEFIYKDSIPIKNVEQLGKAVNIVEIRKTEGFNIDNPAKSILKRALGDTKEAVAIEFMD